MEGGENNGDEDDNEDVIIPGGEEAARARLGRSEGVATLQLTENLIIVTGSKCDTRKHGYTHYPGSSQGNLIGPINVRGYETC